MPCYTQRTVTLDLNAADRDVLLRGLTAAGWVAATGMTNKSRIVARKGGLSVEIANGKITVTGSSPTDAQAGKAVNAIKQAYAAEAVRTASRRFGWTYKATGENTATLGRRY